MSFVPDPSPYRDLVAGVITGEEFLALHDEMDARWQGPTRSTYGDWFNGALAWVQAHPELGLMDFQARQFADDTAWVYEGHNIDSSSFDKAWDHFLSGLSGGPHHVPLEGYDLDLWRKGVRLRSLQEMEEAAVDRGIEHPELEKVLEPWGSWIEDAIDIHSSTIQEFLDDWLSGAISASPHHVPLDPQHEEERAVERARVMQMECYSSLLHTARVWELQELIKQERPGFPLRDRSSHFSC